MIGVIIWIQGHTGEFEEIMAYGQNFSLVHCPRLITELFIIQLTDNTQPDQKQSSISIWYE